MPTRRRTADIGCVAALAALAVLAYRNVTRLWWTFDDPALIAVVRDRSWSELLFGRDLWHHFFANVFNPLLLLSLKADLAAFGLDARPWYVHHLVSFALIAPLSYVLLRQWLLPAPSFCGALLVIAGVPSVQLVHSLMYRHYIEGLVLALLSAIFFAVATRRESLGWSIASASMYLLAAAAKEVFIPLPLMFLAMMRGAPGDPAGRRPPRRALMLLPQAIAFAAYMTWRLAIFGTSLRAYGWAAGRERWAGLIATMPFRIIRVFADHAGLTGWILIALVVIAAAAWVASGERASGPLSYAILAVIVAIAPIIPVGVEIQPRYALMLWLLAAIAVAFAWRVPHVGAALVVVTVIGAIVVNRIDSAHTYRIAKRMSDESRLLASIGPRDFLWLPASPPNTLSALSTTMQAAGHWTYDLLPLCAGRIAPSRVWVYEPDRHRLAPRNPRDVPSGCSSVRNEPLSIRFRYAADTLYWSFGPYSDGRYTVVLEDGRQAFDVPRDGAFRFPEVASLPLRVRYDAPAGWATYSADVAFPVREGTDFQWRR